MIGVCIGSQTHQITCMNYVQFPRYQLYLIKAMKIIAVLLGRHSEVNTTYSTANVVHVSAMTSFIWSFLLNSYHFSFLRDSKHPQTKELSFGHFKKTNTKKFRGKDPLFYRSVREQKTKVWGIELRG